MGTIQPKVGEPLSEELMLVQAAKGGDVAAFEINKQDFTDVMDVLQAKTGLKARLEEVSH